MTRIQTLEERREKLTLRFAEKTYKNSKFSPWFTAHPVPTIPTRRQKPPLRPVEARTTNFRKSAVPHLTATLNTLLSKPETERRKCDKCDREFSSKNNLKTHDKFKHNSTHTPSYFK